MSRVSQLIARVGWLILPVFLAGLAHVLVLKADVLPGLALPVDGGRQWGSQPLLGSRKTWRGILVMVVCAAGFTRLQASIERNRRSRVLNITHDYRVSPAIAGGLMGLGYCLAELPNSFAKRRLGIPPGARSAGGAGAQYMADQTDSVVGCLMMLHLFYRPRRGEVVAAFVLGTAIHVGVDRLLHVIGVKRQ